jgi:hypothetical protein
MRLIPKNWDTFQHYKDRSPPWIKLHRGLLNDRAFISLSIAGKALAPMLWLLASESKDGSFDASIDELEFRLRLSRNDIESGLKSLIDKGFFVDASGAIAVRFPVAIPERETEREGETETEKKVAIEIPDWIPLKDWNDFVAMRKQIKKPMTDRAKSIVLAKLQEMKDRGVDISVVLQNSIENNWQGVFEPKIQTIMKPAKDWWMNDRRLK